MFAAELVLLVGSVMAMVGPVVTARVVAAGLIMYFAVELGHGGGRRGG